MSSLNPFTMFCNCISLSWVGNYLTFYRAWTPLVTASHWKSGNFLLNLATSERMKIFSIGLCRFFNFVEIMNRLMLNHHWKPETTRLIHLCVLIIHIKFLYFSFQAYLRSDIELFISHSGAQICYNYTNCGSKNLYIPRFYCKSQLPKVLVKINISIGVRKTSSTHSSGKVLFSGFKFYFAIRNKSTPISLLFSIPT